MLLQTISTSVALEGFPQETTLSARVTAYSLWYQSDPTQSQTISSKPSRKLRLLLHVVFMRVHMHYHSIEAPYNVQLS